MDDFLTKPVDTGRLESLLRTHASGPEEATPPSGTTPAPTAATEPAPAPTIGPALDAERLEELEALGERAVALVDRAIDNFAKGLPETLDELHDAAARDDLEQVRALAHRLRGSALNLGATRVAEVGLAIELWEESSPDDVPTLLEQLRDAGAEAEDALRAHQALRPRAAAS
jgi:HPt (histidine-containing phosphotransfer) domain-containing protein